jgi:hypothetical protein
MNVMYPYKITQPATHDRINFEIVGSKFHRKTTRPAKKRKTERWSMAGKASNTHGRRKFSTPSA